MKITLCDHNGISGVGSDGHIHVDGRFGLQRAGEEVRQYRERFKAHFRWKYDEWSHWFYDSNPFRIFPIPGAAEQQAQEAEEMARHRMDLIRDARACQ